jgi:hypothetical protein
MIATVAGGVFYRWRGMDGPLPKLIEIVLFCALPCALVLLVAPWWAALLALAASAAAVSDGHGDGIDFGHSPRRDPSEWPNYVLYRIPGLPKDGYLHDSLFMALSGASHTLAPAFALSLYGQHLWAVVLLCGGIAKGLAYTIGWAVRDRFGEVGPKGWSAGTEWGEVLTGAFIGLAVDVILVLALLL